MVVLLKVAVRNILRNRRRSLMSIGAIAVGAAAMVVFGGFIAVIILGTQTDMVRRTGHLVVYRQGYFHFGSGNPAAWGIPAYSRVLARLRGDEVLASMSNVVTPVLALSGIAGNFAAGASRTFIGAGVVPRDRARMRRWNPYAIQYLPAPPDDGLDDDDAARGVIGTGLARVLGLCAPLGLPDCPPAPLTAEATPDGPVIADIVALAASETGAEPTSPDQRPRIDLLAATASGAPNVIAMVVSRAESQGIKELDDASVIMHFDLAQRLLYGRAAPRATAIVVQLHDTADLPAAKSRLADLVAGQDLDVRDFMEIVPFYGQVLAMFSAIFGFIAAIIAAVVLFMVINTMSMAVMERTAEIGTARAIGLRRAGIHRLFLMEGWLLGVTGASVGIVVGFIVAVIVNHAGLDWLPPGQAAPLPLTVKIAGLWPLHLAIWLGLMAASAAASILPANRAARLPIVDSLRHV